MQKLKVSILSMVVESVGVGERERESGEESSSPSGNGSEWMI